MKSFIEYTDEQELDEGVKSRLAAAALAATVAGHSAPVHSFVGMPVPQQTHVKKVAVKQPDGSVILKTVPKPDKKAGETKK